MVRLGAHSLQRQEGCEQTRTATESFPHPDFNNSLPNRDHRNDIMLVKMRTPAHLTWAVRPLTVSPCCVPAGANCLISGWGTMSSPQCRGSRGERDGELGGARWLKSQDSGSQRNLQRRELAVIQEAAMRGCQ